MFEGSTSSGAERAYKEALDKLTGHLVDAGVLGVVELKLTEKNKKIAATAYEYKAVHRYVGDDDDWGEIRFDFKEIDDSLGVGAGENTVWELIAAAVFYIPLTPPKRVCPVW